MIRTAAVIAAVLFAAPALAADRVGTLSAQTGTVLINQGEEFITATEGQPLMAGDRVMVMEGGSAELTFLDGCVLPVVSGSLLDVPATSTCAGTVASVQTIGPSYAQAVGAPTAGSSRAAEWWVFGTWGAGIAYELIESNSSLRPAPPVSP
jgi:hypothetical protein